MAAASSKAGGLLSDRLAEFLTGLRELVFPGVCGVCASGLESGLAHVCLPCRAQLTALDLHTLPENEMTDRFWGLLPVERAAALLPYGEGTSAQRLMMGLKYDDRPQIGVGLGGWLGQLLTESAVFGGVDVVVPVPLYPRKQRVRGYNQAERVAAGIAGPLGAEVLPHAVRRRRDTETQTKKTRAERMANVDDVFELQQPERVRSRRVLLVDDVMTTGATLEALGKAVLVGEPASLKVGVLGLVRR